MQIWINRVQDQALATAKAREKTLKMPLKARNLDLNYSTFYMKYYYFL